MDFFIGALRDRDFRIALRRARPNTLNEALNLALEIEAIEQAEGVSKPSRYTCAVSHESSNMDLSHRMEQLELKMTRLAEENNRLLNSHKGPGGVSRPPYSGRSFASC